MRYFLEIAYKGTAYAGWQIQKNAYTVQQEINEALEKVLRQEVKTIGSGRTDTGVHAEQQYVHLDIDRELNDHLVHRINCILSRDIVIKNFFPVSEKAHARFDAISRSYEYRISRVKNPFLQDLSYFFGKPLDLGAMNQACRILYKYQDFESFSKVKTSVDHFLCDITYANWVERGDLYVFEIKANRFLRGMVRALGGTLLDVGKGKLTLDGFEKIIQEKDRRKAGSALPPQGLFLFKIEYPPDIFL